MSTVGGLFKNFTKDNLSSLNRAKQSIMRRYRKAILEHYPDMKDDIESEIFPKKGTMNLGTWKSTHGHKVTFIMDANYVVWFFTVRDSKPIPTLRTLHQYPDLLPRFQVDEGAIRFVLKGSDIFCQGFTSPGGKLVDVEKNTIVAVYAENKKHACSIGLCELSSEQIRKKNKGKAVFQYNFLNDPLWKIKDFEP